MLNERSGFQEKSLVPKRSDACELWERKKVRLFQSQVLRKNCAGLGKCARRYACFFGVLLALRRLDPKERSLAGGSAEANQGYQTFLAGGT